MEDVTVMFGWLGFFAAAFLSWYYYLQARTKERTLLIEKGADASNFYAKKPERRGFRFPWLKMGLLLSGLSFGLGGSLAVIYSISNGRFDDDFIGFVFASTIFFAAIGMIIAHFTDKKKAK